MNINTKIKRIDFLLELDIYLEIFVVAQDRMNMVLSLISDNVEIVQFFWKLIGGHIRSQEKNIYIQDIDEKEM